MAHQNHDDAIIKNMCGHFTLIRQYILKVRFRTKFPRRVSSPRMQSSSRASGFAQVIVVGGVAAIAALIAAMMPLTQSTSTATSGLERLLRVEVLARSASARLLTAIESRGDLFEQQALDGPVALTLADRTLAVSLEGETGKIDVLRSPSEMLARLGQDLGVEPGSRATFEAEIEEARRHDASRTLAVVQRWLAPLHPDLDTVVTMFGSEHIDPTYAGIEVLSAIPDLSQADAARILSVPRTNRGQFAELSEHLAVNTRRFSIAVRIEWAADQISIRRLPIELSTSGRAIVLAGPY